MFRVTGLPDRVKVGPYSYRFSVEDEVWSDPCGEDEGERHRLYGQFRSFDQVIRVQRDYECAGQAIDTVTHELLHAIWWAYHLGRKLPEEPAVTNIATGWTALLIDNPELDRWFTRAFKVARTK